MSEKISYSAQHRRRMKLGALRLLVTLVALRLWCWLSSRELIAIALVEHFGDIVACEPVIRHLKHEHPKAFLVWICSSRYAELVGSHPGVNVVATVPCLTSWIRVRRFQLAHRQIDLHINGRFCPGCRIPIENAFSDTRITLENYFDFGALLPTFCRAAGLLALSEAPHVHIPSDVKEKIDRIGLPPRYVVFHCKSNETSRDWTAAKWNEFASLISTKLQMQVIEVGSEAMLVRGEDCGEFLELCGHASLLETAEVIARATLFVGVESGPAHLANAVGTPGVVLIGRYRAFENYFPYTGFYAHGGAVLVRSAGSVQSLTVEEVFAAVEKQFAERVPAPSPAEIHAPVLDH